jgi:3-hydroxyisobutyrate dehydrogenase
MGQPMATRLAAAGEELLLCDVRDDAAMTLAQRTGGRAVRRDELVSVAGRVSVVILMLPSSTAVEEILSGSSGLLANLAPDALVIDMGSSRPASTVKLAEGAQRRGVDLIDAPVSGGVPRATSGELSIMVGGSESAVERAMPLLTRLGTTITRVGPVGAGHAMKSLNNLLSAIGLVGASEVLAIGRKFGLAPDVMLDVLNGSTGGNHATKVKMSRYVLSRAFDSGFALDLMVKDLRTALDLAHDTRTPAPLSATCLEEWQAAAEQLGGRADHTQIAAYVEAQAGIELR